MCADDPGRYVEVVARERKPSGLPEQRIGGSLLGGFESQIDGNVGFRPEGVRRVRNAFVVLALLIGAGVVAVLVAGNTDAAIGMSMALLAPVVIFAVISQLILWYAEQPR